MTRIRHQQIDLSLTSVSSLNLRPWLILVFALHTLIVLALLWRSSIIVLHSELNPLPYPTMYRICQCTYGGIHICNELDSLTVFRIEYTPIVILLSQYTMIHA